MTRTVRRNLPLNVASALPASSPVIVPAPSSPAAWEMSWPSKCPPSSITSFGFSDPTISPTTFWLVPPRCGCSISD